MKTNILSLLFLLLSSVGFGMEKTEIIPNFDPNSKKFVNLEPENSKLDSVNFFKKIGILKDIFFDNSAKLPKSELPSVKPDINDFLLASEHVKFIWFGHSTLLLNIDEKIILIDPVFSDYAFSLDFFVKRFQAPVLNLEELPPIDIILISHNHYDHLDKKSIQFFKNKKTKIFVPLGVSALIEDWGIDKKRIKEFDWHDSIEENGIHFTSTPARHFSGRGLFDKYETLWQSWVIKGKNENIYYSGDSGYGKHFKMIGEKYGPFDLAFIENGQYHEYWPDIHMLPEHSIQAFLDLKGKYYVPIHWGMFHLSSHNWDDPVLRTSALAKEKNINYLSPKLGEIVELGVSNEFLPWWEKIMSKK